MRSVLVTGGGGFIGSHLVDGLLGAGHSVRVLDNFATGKRENIEHCRDDVQLYEGDVRDLAVVERAVRGVDAVLHQAALPSVPRSIREPTATNDVNVGGTVNVLDAARRAGVGRVVYASSSSAYGDSAGLPKRETMPANPKSPYAVSKFAPEHYCRVFSEVYGLETLSLRYFNVFGARQDPSSQYSGVIARFCTAALDRRPYTIFGDGGQSRDFTYVSNVVAGNLAALDAPGTTGEVINVACGRRITLLEMIGLLDELTGSIGERHFEPDRAGDVRHSQAAIDRATELLGYRPVVNFEEGIERTLRWYAEQAGGQSARA
jgi:nucleoside-diphosphate-sugar epimerase